MGLRDEQIAWRDFIVSYNISVNCVRNPEGPRACTDIGEIFHKLKSCKGVISLNIHVCL